METFAKFLHDVLGQFFNNLWNAFSGIFIGIFNMLNVGKYVSIFDDNSKGFNALGWILAIFTMLLLIALICGIVYLVILAVKRFNKIKQANSNSKELIEEIQSLSNQVIRLTKEKDRILGIRTGGGLSGLVIPTDDGGYVEAQEGNDLASTDNVSRFTKLIQIDEMYANYDRASEKFDNEITLKQICTNFRNYACSHMGLYYEERVIRLFLAAFASTRLVILQGISGTGKTSLPYAWGKYLDNDAQIASVQPSWRDRSELFGYFNEFTKRFSETEVLKRMYEATYTDKVYLTILDEMNIARVEYYFAEMLSILEMPSRDEWLVDLVPSGWDTDPKHIVEGRFKLPENMWYIGTANNDDSTFAISDKVYDRAIPINIDTKGVPFEAPMTPKLKLNYKHLEEMFEKAKEEHKVSEDSLEKIAKLDDYVIAHFRLAFGNRIVKQLRDFIPAYVACGGTELDGLDYVLTNKIFRKFEGLNLAFIRDEIDGLMSYLSELFGEDSMQEAKAYLARLKKLV